MQVIRELTRTDASACDSIIAGLPDWFGSENGIRQCAVAVRAERGFVAEHDGHVVGFLTYVIAPDEAEITWMAVAADHRGTGIGSSLIDAVITRLRAADIGRLLVKTLSDREDPGPEYAQTRAFYLAMGFVPEAELDIWGPENPAQLLAKRL
jgi:GNAT superfamily N-acetyltransferase